MYVVPVVPQLPVVEQSPVILRTLTPIPGFLTSPHNLKDILFDNQSYIGSDSQVFSTEENPVYIQSSQLVQFEQVLHVGVQTGVTIQPDDVASGVGVGVGVISIMVEHS